MGKREPVETVSRFTPWARFQHLAVMLLFTLLVVTGLPQKWPYVAMSRWLIGVLGGIEAVRWLHRAVGIAFAAMVVAHLAHIIAGVASRRMQPTMLLTRADFTDAIHNLGYYLGWRERPPEFGRYDYRQKFEYWGLVFGGLVMVGTGFFLFYPVFFSQWFPADLIPAAKVMHSNEALLAFLVVVFWHMYGAHFNPDVFPMDTSIFTGRISKERLRHEHRLEYEEMFPDR